jgi:Ca2+-binding RTX toxin-like protein
VFDGDDILAGNDQIVESDNATVDAKDNLYGEAGDDTRFGTDSDNILDGGTGADKIYSGDGSDTIVLRSGDGGSALANADTIFEYMDGTDVIGLDDGLLYSDLTIVQGTGSNSSDTVISYGSEYLAILTGTTVSNINYFDFASVATGNQSFTGTSVVDVFIGAAGVDTVTTNNGADVVLTASGDDAITIDGTGNKTIDGGSGTDSLTISVSGISGLGDYTPTASGDYTVLTDSSSNFIKFKNIENLTVGSYAYINDTSNDTFWNATEKALYMYDGGSTSSSSITDLSGFSASANLSVVGSGLADSMNLNIDRSSALTGNLTLSMGDGIDGFYSSKFKNGDSVDMGAGDDIVYVMVGGGSGTPAFGSFDMAKFDGGAGTDTLYFAISKEPKAGVPLPPPTIT